MSGLHTVEVAREVAMTMRDGVRLMADVYTPTGPGPYPVLLMRSPYDKTTSEYFSILHPEWYARQGLIVVSQDVRGCFTSEGTFNPFHGEAEDGVDTIAACRRLPKANGRVGMYGFSYPGIVQLMAAIHRPDGLAAIAPSFTCDGTYADWTYRHGVLQLAFAQSWASALAVPEAFRRGSDSDIATALNAAGAIAGSYGHLPLDDHPLIDRRFAPFYYDGWRTRCTTASGARSTSRGAMARSTSPRSIWAVGTTSSSMARSATSRACAQAPARRRRASPSAW